MMGAVSIIIVVAVLLAWLVPLIVGLRLLRGPQRTAGLILTILGIVWAIPSLMALVLGGMYWSSARSNFEIKDFKLADFAGVTGVIRTPCQGPCTLTAARKGERERARYVGENGAFKLPIGRYVLQEFTVQAQSPSGAKWEGQSRLSSHSPLEVTRDKPLDLKVGPPYVATVNVKQYGTTTNLSLQVKDCGDNDAKLQQTGHAAAAPGFVITDKAGKVLFTGKFAYG